MANMLYNGVELPDIDSVWPDKDTNPAAIITYEHERGFYDVRISETEFSCYMGGALGTQLYIGGTGGAVYRLIDGAWSELAGATSNTGLRVAAYDFVWSNHDIINTDGAIFLAASVPVPAGGMATKFDLIPWLKGFALGLAGLPLPFSLPLWYSYGGTVLARLPEWDKEIRPYALIWEMSAGIYALMCSDVVTVIRDGKWYCPVDTTFYFGMIKTGDRKWSMSEDLLEEPAGDKGVTADKIIWSNFDLTDENGAVVIGASVPTVVQDVTQTAPAEKWETLFNGELNTSSAMHYKGYVFMGIHKTEDGVNTLKAGDGVRLTVNGETIMYTAETDSSGNIINMGNIWLTHFPSADDEDDDGTDYCIREYDGSLWFAVRDWGTYTVKIERALFEPLAYLYNGVKLPALPELVYPYAFIDFYDNGDDITKNYDLYILSDPEHETLLGFPLPGGNGKGPGKRYEPNADGTWILVEEWEAGSMPFMPPQKPIWANYDYLVENSTTVILKASEPVPVYEPEPVAHLYSGAQHNATSIALGWIQARRIIGQRSAKIADTETIVVSALYGEVDPKTATLVMGELEDLDQTYVPYGIVGASNTITLRGTHLTVEGELDDDQKEDTEAAAEQSDT